MTKIKGLRGVLITCMILVLTTVTCFAAIKIVSYNSHGSNNDFMSSPTEKEMKDIAGFVPKYVESFSNGFVFEKGGKGESSANDESGKAVKTVKTVSLNYAKEDKSVHLSVEEEKMSPDALLDDEEWIDTIKDVKGKYSENMYKFLPLDYEMTEQDKQDEADGTYVFSYGTQEIEINHIQSVIWVQDGMSYTLTSMDDGVIKDELIQMAEEIVKK